MTILTNEIRRGKMSLLVWTASLSFMLAVCVFIYPEMSGQMNEMSAMFADMGSFSEAFGMDQLNFGEYKGYFGVECGNTLGMGGAIFAALLGISAIGKEEKEHTAEFLLTHPVSRQRVYREKLLAVFLQILILNVVIATITVGATLMIGETLPRGETAILFLAFTMLQWQIAGITFGLSPYLKGGGLGIGIGIGLGLYFLSLLANLMENGDIVKYITPFAYTNSSVIYDIGHPEWKYVLSGAIITTVVLLLGWAKWNKKDIS